MANKRHQPMPNVKGASPGTESSSSAKMKMKTTNYGGLPGKAGPNRSGGTKKLKINAQEKGL